MGADGDVEADGLIAALRNGTSVRVDLGGAAFTLSPRSDNRVEVLSHEESRRLGRPAVQMTTIDAIAPHAAEFLVVRTPTASRHRTRGPRITVRDRAAQVLDALDHGVGAAVVLDNGDEVRLAPRPGTDEVVVTDLARSGRGLRTEAVVDRSAITVDADDRLHTGDHRRAPAVVIDYERADAARPTMHQTFQRALDLRVFGRASESPAPAPRRAPRRSPPALGR